MKFLFLRKLHIAQAREALDFKAYPTHRVHYHHATDDITPLVHCKEFTVNLYDLTSPFRIDHTWLDSFVIYVAYEGKALFHTDEETILLQAGETILFPATTAFVNIEPQSTHFKALETFC